MPKVVNATEQRRQIRQAAREVFRRRGVVGLAHVAEAAGIGRSSVYHYYPDKGALVRHLVRDLIAEEEALFQGAADGPGRPLERIERLVGATPGLFPEWAQAGRLLLELRSKDARLFRAFFRRIREALAGAIREGQHAGEIDRGLEPELAAATVIGAIDGLLLQVLVDAAAFPEPDRLRETLVTIVRKALQP